MIINVVRMKYIVIIGVVLLMSCGNGKGGRINEPYDGGHGVGIDTATVHEIGRYEDSTPAKEPVSHTVPDTLWVVPKPHRARIPASPM